jgi:hypothetical protein
VRPRLPRGAGAGDGAGERGQRRGEQRAGNGQRVFAVYFEDEPVVADDVDGHAQAQAAHSRRPAVVERHLGRIGVGRTGRQRQRLAVAHEQPGDRRRRQRAHERQRLLDRVELGVVAVIIRGHGRVCTTGARPATAASSRRRP